MTAEMHTKEIQNGQLIDVTYTAKAKTIHIPSNFVTSSNSVNYDYALISFGDFTDTSGNIADTADYKIQFGVMSNYFEEEGKKELTSVGFVYNDATNSVSRYQSTGEIISMQSVYPNEYRYRFHMKAEGINGKSGGMTYFDSNVSEDERPIINNCSVVGITTHINTTEPHESYGVKITPTLLRFYLQNSNI